MKLFQRLQDISNPLKPKKPTVLLVDPEAPVAHQPPAVMADGKGGVPAVADSPKANGVAPASSESIVQYGTVVDAGPSPAVPKRGKALVVSIVLGAACLLAGVAAYLGFSVYNHLQKPGSLTDDEYHAFDRTVAQYDKWREEVLARIRGEGGAVPPPKAFGLLESKLNLPPEDAVRACLRRHLPGYVKIQSIEPLAYRKVGDSEEIDYRVTVQPEADIYVVPTFGSAAPDNAPDLVKQVWPYLLLDPTLPPGMYHPVNQKYLLAKADQNFVFPWKVERAKVVDGKWKILRAEPPLLEWNDGFKAAGLQVALRGSTDPLFLSRTGELEEELTNYQAAIDNLQSSYASMEADTESAQKELYGEVSKAPGHMKTSIDKEAVKRARSDGFAEGMSKGQDFSDNTLANMEGTTGTGAVPYAEMAVPFLSGLFNSGKRAKEEEARQRAANRAAYYARKARHEREQKEAERKGKEYHDQQEAKFVQGYKDAAFRRVDDIHGFIRKVAMAEDGAGKSTAGMGER